MTDKPNETMAKQNPNQVQNPFENIIKRADSFSTEMKKLQTTYEDIQHKIGNVSQQEKVLQKEREDIVSSENKLENDLTSLLQTVHSFLKQTIAYSNEVYRRNQAEIKYWVQAEAAQRALAESAQKVLYETSQRAKAEVEYRRSAEEMHKKLLEQTQKAQADMAQQVKAEISKTGSIILDNKKVSEEMVLEKDPGRDTLKNAEIDGIVMKETTGAKNKESDNAEKDDKKKFGVFGKKEN